MLALAHVPEKRRPVFRQGHARLKEFSEFVMLDRLPGMTMWDEVRAPLFQLEAMAL
jgi:hypothetical protein